MKNRLRNLVTLLSLLLCVTVVTMWIRSVVAYDAWGKWYRRADAVEYSGGRRVETRVDSRFRGLESVNGGLGIGGWRWDQAKRSQATFAMEWEPAPDEDRLGWGRIVAPARPTGVPFGCMSTRMRGGMGFAVVDSPRWPAGGGVRAVVVPYWFLAAATAAYPLWRLARLRLRRRNAAHIPCPRCGYDLTANLSGTCPECGTAITVRSPARSKEAVDATRKIEKPLSVL